MVPGQYLRNTIPILLIVKKIEKNFKKMNIIKLQVINFTFYYYFGLYFMCNNFKDTCLTKMSSFK